MDFVIDGAAGFATTMAAVAPAAIIKGVISGGIKAAIPAYMAKKVILVSPIFITIMNYIELY